MPPDYNRAAQLFSPISTVGLRLAWPDRCRRYRRRWTPSAASRRRLLSSWRSDWSRTRGSWSISFRRRRRRGKRFVGTPARCRPDSGRWISFQVKLCDVIGGELRSELVVPEADLVLREARLWTDLNEVLGRRWITAFAQKAAHVTSSTAELIIINIIHILNLRDPWSHGLHNIPFR